MAIVIPIGTDASTAHRPILIWVVLGISILSSIILWFNHPASLLLGEQSLVLEHRFHAMLDGDLDDDGEGAFHRRKTGSTTKAKVEYYDFMISGLGETRRGPITADGKKSIQDDLDESLKKNDLTEAEHRNLTAKLDERRVASEPFVEAWSSLDAEDPDGIIGQKQFDRTMKRVKKAADAGTLSEDEHSEINAIAQRKKPVNEHLAQRAVKKVEDLPWLLAPYGAPSPWWRWVVASFVNLRIYEAVLFIGLLASLGFVIEGKVGWKVFVVLFPVVVVGTGGMISLLGRDCPAITYFNGISRVVCVFAGMLACWAPLNQVRQIVWWFRGQSTFPLPIWLLALVAPVAQAIFSTISGMPMSAAIILGIACPVIGFLLAVVMLKLRLVASEGEDVLAKFFGHRSVTSVAAVAGLAPARSTSAAAAKSGTTRIATSDSAAVTKVKTRPGEVVVVAGLSAKQQAEPATAPAEAASLMEWITAAMRGGDVDGAFNRYRRLVEKSGEWLPPVDLIDRLGKWLYKQNAYDQALTVVQDLIRRYPHPQTFDARLIAGTILLSQHGDPEGALEQFNAIDPDRMKESRRDRLNQLIAEAHERVAAGQVKKTPANGEGGGNYEFQ